MAKHPAQIPGFINIQEAAEFICDLDYKTLHEFLHQMSNKLTCDAIADRKRGNLRLAEHLFHAGEYMTCAAMEIEDAAEIKPKKQL